MLKDNRILPGYTTTLSVPIVTVAAAEGTSNTDTVDVRLAPSTRENTEDAVTNGMLSSVPFAVSKVSTAHCPAVTAWAGTADSLDVSSWTLDTASVSQVVLKSGSVASETAGDDENTCANASPAETSVMAGGNTHNTAGYSRIKQHSMGNRSNV